jgi:hypothetical protein
MHQRPVVTEVAPLGTDEGAPLGEETGELGEPGQKLRIAVTAMGGYWRVDAFGDGVYKTWDCKNVSDLGAALANAYSLIRNIDP